MARLDRGAVLAGSLGAKQGWKTLRLLRTKDVGSFISRPRFGGVSGHAGHTYAREGKLVRDTKSRQR
jgi:hypothetical protein